MEKKEKKKIDVGIALGVTSIGVGFGFLIWSLIELAQLGQGPSPEHTGWLLASLAAMILIIAAAGLIGLIGEEEYRYGKKS